MSIIKKWYDYKPIPKYKKGDMVYRRWANIWMHHPEPISRVFVKEWNGKWLIEYYFPRERTPYGEHEIYATLEDILKAETEDIIKSAKGHLKSVMECAKKNGISLDDKNAKLLEM